MCKYNTFTIYYKRGEWNEENWSSFKLQFFVLYLFGEIVVGKVFKMLQQFERFWTFIWIVR